jgi:hypothetical protein
MSSAPPTRLGPEPKKGTWERIIDTIQNTVVPITVEFLRLLPDGLVFGVGLLSLLSFCKSYAVLLFTMFELMIIQRLFSNFIGSIAPTGAGVNANSAVCQNGFAFPNMMRITMVDAIGSSNAFPSSTMFFLTGVVTYIIGTIQEFQREIVTLGGDVNMRTGAATAFSVLFILGMFIYRIVYGCDSFGNVLLTVILGILMGIALVYQNAALFGRDGINMLNIPMIITAAEAGKPMYVCAPSS